jgi:hypothetical protein
MNNNNNSSTAFERHAQTLLTTLIAFLLAGVAAFIFQIKDSQSAQLTEIRVLQVQVSSLTADLKQRDVITDRTINQIRDELRRIEDYQNTMWARLRNASENIVILHRAVETATKTKIDLEEPERF